MVRDTGLKERPYCKAQYDKDSTCRTNELCVTILQNHYEANIAVNLAAECCYEAIG